MGNQKYNIPELFGKNVQKFRKEKGFTQEELSGKLEITQKHLSVIENGNQFASAALIEKLCEVLDVTPSSLFGDDATQKNFDRLYSRLAGFFENKINLSTSRILNEIKSEKKLDQYSDCH